MASLRLLAVGLALSFLVSVQASTLTATPTTTRSSNACATVSALQASYYSANPSATSVSFPASVAYECALSAPVVQEDALQLIDGLSAFLEWQSDLAYLKTPPAGYPWPSVDLLGGLQQIRAQVQNKTFTSEYVFEQAINQLIANARDGHLTYRMDCLSVFGFAMNISNLVSVSLDGTSLPQVFLQSDILYLLETTEAVISPVVAINGNDAVDYLQSLSLYVSGLQDLDALWNTLFYEVSTAESGTPLGGLPNGFYPGEWTNLTFANGSSLISMNYAFTSSSFESVTDGESFYNAFCNATAKIVAASNATGSGESRKVKATASTTSQISSTTGTTTQPTTAVAYPRSAYPSPLVVSNDGSFAGYFFSNASGLGDVAVISLLGFSETALFSSQQAMTQFLELCQKEGKEYLIFDVSSNGGGEIILGYDFMKQLFPNLEPFAAASMRAHPAFNITSDFDTALVTQDRNRVPFNATQFLTDKGDTAWDGNGFLNQYGVPFQSWTEYFGPETRHGDNFTRLARFPYWQPLFDEAWGDAGFVVSNANGSNHSGPFKPKNMVILSDGFCGSTCTTFTHFLKWQAKVPSILVGGRPQFGPAQSIGGIKGKNVLGIGVFTDLASAFYEVAPTSVQVVANQTSFKALADNVEYLAYRCQNPAQAGTQLSLNFMNSIAEGDDTFTPLQFIDEAADCRLWLTPQTSQSIASQWAEVAEQAFGLNNIKRFSRCVLGSTNAPSSLLANPTLYNNGIPTNVTTFASEPGVSNTSTSSTSKPIGNEHYRYMKAWKA